VASSGLAAVRMFWHTPTGFYPVISKARCPAATPVRRMDRPHRSKTLNDSPLTLRLEVCSSCVSFRMLRPNHPVCTSSELLTAPAIYGCSHYPQALPIALARERYER
jgi:hypothetical protein